MSDILLDLTGDGGEIGIDNMTPALTSGLENYILISLFGSDNNNWFDNYMSESEKFTSEFSRFINSNAKTGKNILKAEKLLKKDLDSMIKDGIADEITTSLTSLSPSLLRVDIFVYKKNQLVAENKYIVNWEYRGA